MTDFLFQVTVSNLLVSTILAVIAWIVHRRYHAASLANLLWALVLIKMITPPLFSVPVVEVPQFFQASKSPASSQASPVFTTVSVPTNTSVGEVTRPNPMESTNTPEPVPSSSAGSWTPNPGLVMLAWISVSAILLLVSSIRITQFHRLFKATSHQRPDLTSRYCDIARRLRLRRCPDVVVTTANVAPFVWWQAGRAIVVISQHALQQLNDADLRFVVTHEMAHIKRRDHWFRWLEWMAVISFWWNPVMWWARTQLRISEEIACDDLVLETTDSKVHPYANSLLNMAELLTSSAIRPPSVASAINGGGNLEQRLKMMIAKETWKVPAVVRWCIVSVAFSVLPLGLVDAQDFEAVEQRLGGAVEAGELSLEQANLMMQSLRRAAGGQHAQEMQMEAKKQRYMAFTEQIKEAVMQGKLSAEDGETKMIAVRMEMFGSPQERQARGKNPEHGAMAAKQNRVRMLAETIKKAVEAGKISQQDAEKKIIAVKMEMFGDHEHGDHEHGDHEHGEHEHGAQKVMDARERRITALAESIKAAVEAGKLSKQDAENKMIAVRVEMLGELDKEHAHGETEEHPRIELHKDRLAEVTRLIESAIGGKLPLDEAGNRDIAVRIEMAGEPKVIRVLGKKADVEGFAEVIEAVEAAVESAMPSKQQLKDKNIEVHVEMIGESGAKATHAESVDKRVMEVTNRRRYTELTKEIEAAIGAGKLTKDEAERKRIEIRVNMFGKPDEKHAHENEAKQSDLEAKKRRYMKVAKEIEAAVDAGKLSRTDADQRLIESRQSMFRVPSEEKAQGNEGREGSLEAKKRRYEQAAKRIKTAIEKGDLSDEEGEEKLAELRQEMSGAGK